MSKELKKLKEQRQHLYEQQEQLYSQAKEEDRTTLNEEENEKYERIEKDFWEKDAAIKRLESMEEKRKAIAEEQGEKHVTEDKPETKANEAFLDYLRNGKADMSAENREVLKSAQRAQGSGDSAGGYTIPAGFSGEIETMLKSYGGMLENCRVMTTAEGNTIDYPTMDDTTNKGKIVSESGSLTSSTTDLTFANKQLGAYKFSSDLLLVPYELLQDSAFDFGNEIMLPALNERIGRVLNQYFTTGTGSSQPTGIMAASDGSAKGADAAAAAISRDNILDLIHSVNQSYRNRPMSKLSFNDSTLKAIKKLAFGSADDRPLYQVSPIVGEADTIEGYKFFVNDDIDDIGAENKSMAFGDWSKYLIRRVSGLRIKRLDERFADNDQVGFVVLGRFDGLPINTAAVKHLLHAAS